MTQKKYVIFYKTSQNDKYFVFSIRDCKSPERTKQYKKLRYFLDSSMVEKIGYCDQDYYDDYADNFINTLNYIKL